MGFKKIRFLVRESMYWINIIADRECTAEQITTYLEYQHMHPQERAWHYKIPYWPWEVVDADICMINGKTLLCIVDCHNKFKIVKKVNSLSADDLVKMAKLICAEYRLQKRNGSDVGTNFMAVTFKALCREMNSQQTITSSHHHKCNGQV